MELAVETLSTSIHQFEGMRAIAIHETVAIWQTSIAEQEGHLHRKYGTEGTRSCHATIP